MEIRERAYILACGEITSTGRIVTHRIRRQAKLAGLAKRSNFDDAGFLNLVALGVEFMSQRQSESKSLAADISQRIEALGNVAAQPIRSLRREISAALKREPGDTVLEVALQLLKRQTFSHRFVAYELVHYHQDALARVNKAARLLNWVGGLSPGPTSIHSLVTSPGQSGHRDKSTTTSSRRGRSRRIGGNAERPW